MSNLEKIALDIASQSFEIIFHFAGYNSTIATLAWNSRNPTWQFTIDNGQPYGAKELYQSTRHGEQHRRLNTIAKRPSQSPTFFLMEPPFCEDPTQGMLYLEKLYEIKGRQSNQS